jgi:hypothetical protein
MNILQQYCALFFAGVVMGSMPEAVGINMGKFPYSVYMCCAGLFTAILAFTAGEYNAVTNAAKNVSAASTEADMPSANTSNDDSDWSGDSDSDVQTPFGSEDDETDRDAIRTLVLNGKQQLLCTSSDGCRQVFLTSCNSIMCSSPLCMEMSATGEPKEDVDVAIDADVDAQCEWTASWNRPVLAATFSATNATILLTLGLRSGTTDSRIYMQEVCAQTGEVLSQARLSMAVTAGGVAAIAHAGDVIAIQHSKVPRCTLYAYSTGKRMRTLELDSFGPLAPGVAFVRRGTALTFMPTDFKTPCMCTLFGESIVVQRVPAEAPLLSAASTSAALVAQAAGDTENSASLLWHA